MRMGHRETGGMIKGIEKLRVRPSIRLVISVALAHRREARDDSLAATEPFDPLDIEGIKDMKEQRKLRERFKFTYLITHVEKAQDIFQPQIIFKKGEKRDTSATRL